MLLSRTVRSLLLLTLASSVLAFASGVEDELGASKKFNEATVPQLEAAMAAGQITSVELTKYYINRILKLDQNGPGVNSVIELNPDALNLARQADRLFKHGIILSPMQGIPVLLKDNIDTGDKMQTTAGALAL